jgi:large subunit ribosomal protein L2
MGKKILVQRRGRGSSTFRAHTHKRRGPAKYRPLAEVAMKSTLAGVITGLYHDPGRGAPVGMVKYEDGVKTLMLLPEDTYVGQTIEHGPTATISIGNILPLEYIPEGTPIFNIEKNPGDGGKFIRSGGCSATVISQSPGVTTVQFPSKILKSFNSKCRATIGVVAGGGRPEKPFMKAGAKYHLISAKGRKWPHVRGVAMNIVSHPHGGGSKQRPGGPTTVSRNAPPGRKVGLIAARRAGRKKRK